MPESGRWFEPILPRTVAVSPMNDHLAHHPPYARWAHVLLRLFASAIILQHGAQKLFGAFGGHAVPIGTLPWAAGVIELIGGTLVLLGLFTRVAAFILSGEMAVAYFLVHFPRDFWPIENRGELAATLCFIFLYLAATGAGAFSVDRIRTRHRPQPIMR